jgi:hypothetical protein
MAAAGVEVHVLGNEMSRGLRFSRSCSSFTESTYTFDGHFDDAMADEINEVCARVGAEVVFPGCALSSRSLYGIKDRLTVPCFPGPTLDQFDFLNNKWEFVQFCQQHEIACPRTLLLTEKSEIQTVLAEGSLSLPVIVKPLAMDGERGVLKLTKASLEADLGHIDYAPLLLQEFVQGDDIGASAFCRSGEILAFMSHRLDRGEYSTFTNEKIHAAISTIARELSLNGVYNFDMRRDLNGFIYFLECNPRFFFKMPLSLVAGINFVLPGIDPNFAARQPAEPGETLTRTQRAWPNLLLTPWRVTKRDRDFSRFLLSDPISFVREMAHIDWD